MGSFLRYAARYLLLRGILGWGRRGGAGWYHRDKIRVNAIHAGGRWVLRTDIGGKEIEVRHRNFNKAKELMRREMGW